MKGRNIWEKNKFSRRVDQKVGQDERGWEAITWEDYRSKEANNGNKAKKEVKAKVYLRGEDKKRSRRIKTNL